jgi:hypothetical protein
MNDKKCRKHRSSLRRIATKWREILGMRSYRFDINYDRSYCTDGAGIATEVKCSWQYKTILVTFYLPVMDGMADDEVEGVIVHELSHVLIHPVSGDLRDDQPDFNEKVEYATTCVGHAIQWADEAGQREGAAGERKRQAGSVGEDVLKRSDELAAVRTKPSV